jgi:hypothetical protein
VGIKINKPINIKVTLLLLVFMCLFFHANMLSAATIFMNDIPTLNRDFWLIHGPLGGTILCLMLAIFPRIALAFIALVTGGIGISILGFLFWFLAPHLLVAIIATTIYWHTNPILVILSWFIAFGGETTEKVYIRRRF